MIVLLHVNFLCVQTSGQQAERAPISKGDEASFWNCQNLDGPCGARVRVGGGGGVIIQKQMFGADDFAVPRLCLLPQPVDSA